MMFYHPPSDALPRIFVSETEEHRLTTLATAAALTQRSRDVARNLLTELERADVVPDRDMPADIVRMNSRVEFEIDGANRRRVEVVFPQDADIDAGKISVLTPIGTALIGLSPGQMMMLRGNDGRPHKLRVISVAHPVTAA
jgi:regulator of nucleoside diphosphate kinase